jgi:CspA family cold shock protein
MNTGTVKFFNATKGFGFVTPDDGGADLFLPATTVVAAGVTAVKPGQRITFEQVPDTKGPKVVSLKLVGEAPAKAPAPSAERVTIYCDASADAAADVVEAVRDSGLSMVTQDYMTAPPDADQLKRLSQMLSAAGQSLVRRYDSLFLALQLDDRFITDQDFWTAIVEHPSLINGPVLATSGRARVCKTASEVRAFLRKDEASVPSAPKMLSPRIAAMMRGETPPAVERASPAAPQPATPAPKASAEKTARAEKPAAKLTPAAKPKRPTEPPVKPKKIAAGPAKAPAKKAAPKKAAKPKAKTRAKK